jgi:hypothetical protein
METKEDNLMRHANLIMAEQSERVFLLILHSVFCVFLFAGVFENMKALAFLPIDLTILAGLLVIGLLTIFLIANPSLHATKPAIITVLLLVGLVIYISVSLLWAGVDDGQGRLFRLSTGGIITMVYPLLAVGTTQWRQKQFLMVLAVAGGAFAVSILAVGGVPNWAPHYIAVARPTGICGVIAFATLATTNSLSRATVALAVAIGCLLMILISGSRGPFIALLISFAFIWTIAYFTPSDDDRVIGRWMSSLRLNTTVLVASLIIFLLVISNPTIFPVESLGNAGRFLTLLRGGGASASIRIQLYEASVVMWLDTPASIFFGQGIGSFISRNGGYPHNIFLELLITGGLVALLWFVTALLWSAQGAISRKESPSFQLIAGLALVVYMLANAQVTGDLYINRYLFVFLGFVSLIRSSTRTLD